MSRQKSAMKLAFERIAGLTPEQANMDQWGHYTHDLTKVLWRMFKAGVAFTPGKGSFVVAEINGFGRPEFTTCPEVLDYKDQARNVCRAKALDRGTVHVVYQQVSAFDPRRTMEVK